MISSKKAFLKENEKVPFQTALALAVGLIYTLTLLPPWIPTFLTSAEFRDPSWRYMLHEGFVQNMEFGKDIIFTYGPFGFLTTQMYHPETYSVMLASWVGLSVLFFAVTWKLSRRFTTSPWLALLFCVIATRVVFVDSMIFFFSFLLLLLAWRISNAAVESGGGELSAFTRKLTRIQLLAVGLLPLTKYTFVPAVFFVVAALAVFDITKKRWPWTRSWASPPNSIRQPFLPLSSPIRKSPGPASPKKKPSSPDANTKWQPTRGQPVAELKRWDAPKA